MALYKLEDGTSSVDFTPIRGLNVVENRIRQHTQNKEGVGDDYEWGNAEKYEIPLINLTKTRADQLLTWWTDMEVLTFTPNQASSGQTIQMIIDGVERPLNQWHHKFKSKYAGNLVLCEVSSQSFSSSHISVSRSESCSSFDSSQSCNFNSSISCNVFLTSVSDSISVGDDDSYSTSRSCSQSVSDSTSRSCFEYSISLGPPANQYVSLSACGDVDVPVSVSSCEDQSSLGSSRSSGIVAVSFTDSSCSLDPSSTSCSVSAAGISCSNSAGGIS